MTTNSWQRLSAREAGLPIDETQFDTAAPHIARPLRDWIQQYSSARFSGRVLLKLQIPSDGADATSQLAEGITDERPLDVIDCMLHLDITGEAFRETFYRGGVEHDPVAQLIEILEDGNSAYTVAVGPDERAYLQRIVDLTVTPAATGAQHDAVAAGRPDAAAHLASAWAKAYAREADPSGSYTDSVKAVEDLAVPLLLPPQDKPTLGTVLVELRRNPDRFELVILGGNAAPAGPEVFTAMARLLWEGHRDRHPGGLTSAPVTLEAAQAAVHLAVTLVQWIAAGTIRRKP
ncbi:hypothetical protein [Streptomyces gardneri]|uniref:hypothetical protein n=1 Tax=Streptomyces gardneri TaxID=66892 RepID=UPI0036CD41BA